MPRPSLQVEIKMNQAIEEYLEQNPMTTASDIADYVQQKTGVRPSPTMIYSHINAKGFKKVWVKDE